MAFLNLYGAAVAAAVAVWLSVCAPAAAVQQPTLENDVKAAFLYNFTRFIDWPSSAFPNPSDPFRVCVVAEQEFVRRVDEVIRGETALGRPMRRVVPTLADVPNCHVLFVGKSQSARASRLLPLAARAPVLTVGDGPNFLAEGGAIGFVLENNRVRFDVNLTATNRAGLIVNAKLLRVARRVWEPQS
jgi:hypothetical protein